MNFPLFGIERIEILWDGAAAIYGADAIGSVVNFITLPPGAATETLFQGSGVTQGSLRQGRVGQVLGGQWSSGETLGQGVLIAQLDRQTPLNSIDRRYLWSDQHPFGGVNHDSLESNPGTLETGGTYMRSPRDCPGTANQPLTPNTFNQTDAAQGAQVIPGQTTESVLGKIQQRWGERWTARAAVLVTHRRASEEGGGAQSQLLIPSTKSIFDIPGW